MVIPMRAPGDQFKYLLHEDKITGHSTAIAYGPHPHTGMTDPIAVVQTQRDTRVNQNQRNMNRYGLPHGQSEGMDPETGMQNQQHWVDGAFDRPAPTKVSWASMTARKPKVLRNLMGVVAEHHGGERLHADDQLTEDGAALSMAMVRRYGIEPHPENPYMVPNTASIGMHGANEINRAMLSVGLRDLEDPYERVGSREIPAAEAHAAGARLRPARSPKPARGAQRMLFDPMTYDVRVKGSVGAPVPAGRR